MGNSRSSESSGSRPESEKEPASAIGWAGLGNKLRTSEPDAALAAFRRAVQMDPNLLSVWLSIAEFLTEKGKKQDAAVAVNRAIALEPKDPDLIERLCVVLLLLGREVEAERFGKRLLALNPEDKRSWSKLRSDLRARTMYRTPVPAATAGAPVGGVPEQGQDQAARTPDVSAQTEMQFSVARQYTPSRKSAMGATMPSQGMASGRAAPPAGQATKPPAPSLYRARSQATTVQNQKVVVGQTPSDQQGKAETAFRRLVEDNPDSLNAVRGLARSLHAEGKLVEAIQVADKGLALKPDDPELLYLLGSSALGTRDFSRAREALQRCTAVSPRSIEAWIDLGYCHISENDANDAARALLSAIRIDPNNAKALVCFAKALMMQNQNARAASVLMKALEVEKVDPDTLTKASGLLLELGQTAAATKARTRAAALRSQNP